MRRLVFAVLCLLLFWTSSAPAGSHVRVVLDVSLSLSRPPPGNDPDRLAILATLLLYDLAKPNKVRGDRFVVIPFDRNWRWRRPEDPPPESRRRRIEARPGRRAQFVRALNALAYDARMTYFYPGLKAAIEDLKSTPGGDYDVRTIVLITDGVPEEDTRERERIMIREDLVPALKKHDIRLYILAFSDQAYNNRDFLREMVLSPDDVLVDPDGSQLLENMIKIFSHSFGYTAEKSRALPRVPPQDLHGGIAPERVAVVVFAKRPSRSPQLDLVPPVSGQLNAPDGVQSARETGASYSMMWVLSPDTGRYELKTDVTGGLVAVLRPTRLKLAVQPSAPDTTQTGKTMAETPFPLRVLVKSPLTTAGVPPPVKLSFQPFGKRVGAGYSWFGHKGAPVGAGMLVPPDGRAYAIRPEFPGNPADPGRVYVGWLEIEVRRGAAVVGQKTGNQAHRVEVHPYLSITPNPLSDYAARQPLKAGENGCTPFFLDLDSGLLPHPNKPEYVVQALLEPDPALLDQELRRAVFTLDDKRLEIRDRITALPGEWYKGWLLNKDQLLGKHELCVRVGKPTRGSPYSPLDIPLNITLREPPYDDFQVIKPFTLRLLLDDPPPFDRTPFIVALLALSGLLALLWYLRHRPTLPDDLGYVLIREGSSPTAMSPLESGSWLARLAGLTASRPLIAEGREEPLAWVRPVDGELFQVRPASGVFVEDFAGDTVLLERGLATLAVQRSYRLRTDQDNYLLRLGYL